MNWQTRWSKPNSGASARVEGLAKARQSERRDNPRRVLLGQLGARGDCVLATPVARQIKSDFPGCHLTWAVGSMCRHIIEGNPFVDAIWEVPVAGHGPTEMIAAWERFRSEARLRNERGDFDQLFLTQIFPDNFGNYDGTVRASIFRGYPRPITAPVTPIIRLSDSDVQQVQAFADEHGLAQYRHVILFEFGSHSGQSFLTPEFAQAVAEVIVTHRDDAAVILSSNTPVSARHPRIIDGSTLPFHLNAELSKHCHLLIGCSSGISWICTSDWAKHLPTIQLLRRDTSVYASMVHDHERFGLPTDSIIEMTDCPPQKVAECAMAALEIGFASARVQFHETIPLHFGFYAQTMEFAWQRGGPRPVARSLVNTLRRYGPRPEFISAISSLAAKNVAERIARRVQWWRRMWELQNKRLRLLRNVEELQNDRSRLASSVEKLENDRSSLLRRVEELEGDRSRLLGTAEELQNDRSRLLLSVEEFQQDRSRLLQSVEEFRNDRSLLLRRVEELENGRSPSPQGVNKGEAQAAHSRSGSATGLGRGTEHVLSIELEPHTSDQLKVPAYYPFPSLEAVDPACFRISIVDVGAEPLEYEGDIYEPLLRAAPCDVIGFDPFIDPSLTDPESGPAPAVAATAGNGKRLLPYFIADGRRRVFHINRFRPTSSLFPTNVVLAQQFSRLAESCETVRTLEVETRRLDDIAEIERCDFLKVDVQGGDYDVVANAVRILEKTIFVHIEAEFAALYRGQPLFADIDSFLRSQGFELIDLVKLGWNTYNVFPSTVLRSRLLWTDCIYMKETNRLAAMDPMLLLRGAYIAHVNYRKYDLAAHLLKSFDEGSNTIHAQTYVEGFRGSAQRS